MSIPFRSWIREKKYSDIIKSTFENDICKKFFEGKNEEAKEMQLRFLPLIHDLFCEVNPIPVKAAMAAMGFGENYLRMPLTPMEENNRMHLLGEMKKLNIIK